MVICARFAEIGLSGAQVHLAALTLDRNCGRGYNYFLLVAILEQVETDSDQSQHCDQGAQAPSNSVCRVRKLDLLFCAELWNNTLIVLGRFARARRWWGLQPAQILARLGKST